MRNRIFFVKNRRPLAILPRTGFTIVELVVVISVVGTLATIGVLSYNGWQKSTATSAIKSDLSSVAAAMENYRNFNSGYPSVIPDTFAHSPDVDMSDIENQTDTTFCISATSIKNPSAGSYHIDQNSGSQGAEAGLCQVIPAPAISGDLIVNLGLSLDGSTVISNITNTTSCSAGSTLQYRNSSTSLDGNNWSNYSVWSINLPSYSASIAFGTTYRYKIQARCVNSGQFSSNIESNDTYIATITAPAAPTLSVNLNSSNVQATIMPVACNAGTTAQYQIKSRTNDGAWLPYSGWSGMLTYSQPANDGVKYGYQAQARCFFSGSIASDLADGSEYTYIDPISATPSAPTVSNSTTSSITTYSWSASTCPAGTVASYQYSYAIDYSGGYISSNYTTSSTSTTYNTSSEGYKYTINVKSKCLNNYVSSSYGSAGNSSYIRPVSYPGTITYGISRDSRYQLSFSAASSCSSGSYLYSRLDLWMTSSYGSQTFWWSSAAYQTAGWYSSANSGIWNINTSEYYGNTITQSVILNSGSGSYYYPPGMPWQVATEMYCKNITTGRTSSSTGRQTSGYLYAPSY
jgi:prepilin-type N-terminal cleavage/methylation domain-containing protein